MQKMVDGILVNLTPAEEYEIEVQAQSVLHARVPQVLTRFQVMMGLHNAGVLEQVQTYVDLPETPVVVKLAWKEAQVFERTSPTLNAAAYTILNWTSEQLDDFFRANSSLTA